MSPVNLRLNGGIEGTTHAIKSELGREAHEVVKRSGSILERVRGETDEVASKVGANRSVRGPLKRGGLANINIVANRLNESLLGLRAGVEANTACTNLLKSRSINVGVILPAKVASRSSAANRGLDGLSGSEGGISTASREGKGSDNGGRAHIWK